MVSLFSHRGVIAGDKDSDPTAKICLERLVDKWLLRCQTGDPRITVSIVSLICCFILGLDSLPQLPLCDWTTPSQTIPPG